MRFGKMAAVTQIAAEPKSTIYWRVSRGEFPPPVKQGERAAALILEEVEQVMRARARGASSEEVRALVRELVAARQRVAAWPEGHEPEVPP